MLNISPAILSNVVAPWRIQQTEADGTTPPAGFVKHSLNTVFPTLGLIASLSIFRALRSKMRQNKRKGIQGPLWEIFFFNAAATAPTMRGTQNNENSREYKKFLVVYCLCLFVAANLIRHYAMVLRKSLVSNALLSRSVVNWRQSLRRNSLSFLFSSVICHWLVDFANNTFSARIGYYFVLLAIPPFSCRPNDTGGRNQSRRQRRSRNCRCRAFSERVTTPNRPLPVPHPPEAQRLDAVINCHIILRGVALRKWLCYSKCTMP